MDSSSLRHSRSYGLALSSLIFLTAIAAVTLLARAPFGEVYGTLLGETGGTRTASITLYGTTKAKVEMSVAEKENAKYIILSIEDLAPFDTPDRVMLSSPSKSEGVSKHNGQATQGDTRGDTQTITLTIPSGWHLEEVRGTRASDIASYGASERTTLMIPMGLLDSPRSGEAHSKRTVELRFTTNEEFEAIAFTHDASSPALFTLVHLTLTDGASEKKSEIVEESAIVEL